MRSLPAIALSVITGLASPAVADDTCTVELTIQGVLSTDGQLLIALFDQAEGFPGESERAVARTIAEPVSPATTVRFEGLPAGTYAAVVVHDENENGALDVRAIIPIPREPLGASRDAMRPFGPPRFGDAAFAVTSAVHTEVVTLTDF